MSPQKTGKVLKKPANITSKVINPQFYKKAYFTYTEEEGNCIDDDVYEQIQEDQGD